MKLTILYDNEVYDKGKELAADWGFSCLIEKEGETLLFDTGANGGILLGNMKALGKDPGKISKVVISHEHFDHKGGLNALTDHLDNSRVYRLEPSRRPIMEEEIVVEGIQMISEGVLSSGKLKHGKTPEQSLFLEGKDGLYILAGCSHPGVRNIMHTAEEVGTIKGLIGGLHGFDDLDLLSALDLVAPCHCTVRKNEILTMFPKTGWRCGVGKVISI